MAEFIRVGSLAEIAPGTVLFAEVGEASVAVANCNGELYAVDNVCTHDGGSLDEGELYCDTYDIECPRHGATFDVRTGKVTALPAVRPIKTYPVRVEDDDVLVEVDE